MIDDGAPKTPPHRQVIDAGRVRELLLRETSHPSGDFGKGREGREIISLRGARVPAEIQTGVEDLLVGEWEEWLELAPESPSDPQMLWRLNCMFYAG